MGEFALESRVFVSTSESSKLNVKSLKLHRRFTPLAHKRSWFSKNCGRRGKSTEDLRRSNFSSLPKMLRNSKIKIVKSFNKTHHEDGYSLFGALKPLQVLTKFIMFMPECVTKASTPLSKSCTDVVLLIYNAITIVLFTASFASSFHSSLVNMQRNQELVTVVEPFLWMLWGVVPTLAHAVVLLNLNRLRDFFHSLNAFTTRNVLLQQYPVTLPKKPVQMVYFSMLPMVVISVVGFAAYLQERSNAPNLITSLPIFQNGPLWYLAYILQIYGVSFLFIIVMTLDIGIGFIFYFIGRTWCSATLFVQDWSLTCEHSSVFNEGVFILWKCYEEFLNLLRKAESLFGFLVALNQLNHLLGTAFFIYTSLRTDNTLSTVLQASFALYSGLFLYRTIVFNTLLSTVYNEHQKFQDALANWLANHRSQDAKAFSHKMVQYSVIRDLLNRVQSIVVAVTPYNIYSVTPGTLCTILSTVVTYLVILLQTK